MKKYKVYINVSALIIILSLISCGGKKEVKEELFKNKNKYESLVQDIKNHDNLFQLNVFNNFLNNHPFQDNNEPLDTTIWVDSVYYLTDLFTKYGIKRSTYNHFKSKLDELACHEFERKKGMISFPIRGFIEEVWGLAYIDSGVPPDDWNWFYLSSTKEIEGKWHYFDGTGK